jgi:BirA family biotin operon repressor/biotin-[acetyl-CoA-carboxylase] ligase
MISIDTDALAGRLRTIESIVVISRVSSTNLLARRVIDECIDGELPAPSAIIIAGEQYAGRGRSTRTWVSPPGRGIWATAIHTRPVDEMPMIPLAVASMVATMLRRHYDIDARIKWPNDILVDGKKIAGILIEGRTQQSSSILIIGVGINAGPVDGDEAPNATSISQELGRQVDLSQAVVEFVERLDGVLSSPLTRREVLGDWRALTVHRDGEGIQCLIGSRTVAGAWAGIDDDGRAILRRGSEEILVSAGDLIMLADGLCSFDER